MANLPGWRDIPKYPVVISVALVATGLTIAWWSGTSMSGLFENAEIRRGQFWRLVTSALLHLDILHLVFNLYWLWVLGTVVERVYGDWKTALLLLLFAIGSGSWEYALADGGIGLSGVGYGLFGMLFVLSKHDERFKGVLDKRTETLFIVWFFACILLTATHVMNVGNFAHGEGLVLGLVVGYTIVHPERRGLLVTVGGLLVFLGFCGSTVARPYVNFSKNGGYEEARWGYEALMNDKKNPETNHEAVMWLEDAVKYQPKVPLFWFNLGIAYQREHDYDAASSAYRRAYELDPSNADYAKAAGKEVPEK